MSVRSSKTSTVRRPALGAHMSIAGGVFNALSHGERADCTAIQLFTKSNQQWRARKLPAEEIEEFFRLREETGILPACAHASYLINLASPDRALYQRSISGLTEELRRCDLLELPELVIHPGAHVGKGIRYGVQRVARAINRAFDKLPEGECRVCLETTAGAGTTLGGKFEELAEIIEGVDSKERLSVCLDTCHLFAAGFDISTRAGYRKTILALDGSVGLRRVAIFHMNDSKFGCGEHKDRHEHIGQGKIGLVAFEEIMNDRRFSAIPKILETPKGESKEADIKNLAILRGLIKGSPVGRGSSKRMEL